MHSFIKYLLILSIFFTGFCKTTYAGIEDGDFSLGNNNSFLPINGNLQGGKWYKYGGTTKVADGMQNWFAQIGGTTGMLVPSKEYVESGLFQFFNCTSLEGNSCEISFMYRYDPVQGENTQAYVVLTYPALPSVIPLIGELDRTGKNYKKMTHFVDNCDDKNKAFSISFYIRKKLPPVNQNNPNLIISTFNVDDVSASCVIHSPEPDTTSINLIPCDMPVLTCWNDSLTSVDCEVTTNCHSPDFYNSVSIPSLSQWGLIILAILMFTTISISLVKQREKEYELLFPARYKHQTQYINKSIFINVLIKLVPILVLILLGISVLENGLFTRNILGVLIAGLVINYLIHFLKLNNVWENE